MQGRGGAGFPLGRKWRMVAQAGSPRRYVVCNFDESEPGTCTNTERRVQMCRKAVAPPGEAREDWRIIAELAVMILAEGERRSKRGPHAGWDYAGTSDIMVPFWQGRFQPLHAAYRSELTSKAKCLLDRGELRPIFLCDMVRTLKIEEDEIRRFDPEGLSFLNINTPSVTRRSSNRRNPAATLSVFRTLRKP